MKNKVLILSLMLLFSLCFVNTTNAQQIDDNSAVAKKTTIRDRHPQIRAKKYNYAAAAKINYDEEINKLEYVNIQPNYIQMLEAEENK